MAMHFISFILLATVAGVAASARSDEVGQSKVVLLHSPLTHVYRALCEAHLPPKPPHEALVHQ